jgi:hypothetical protein
MDVENHKPSGIFRYLSIAWVILVAGGAFSLAKYGATPASHVIHDINGKLPRLFGAGSDRMTLVMFVHPKCPCSDASIAEFSELMERCGNRVNAQVVVFQPSGQPDDWSRTSLVHSASEIPGVQVRADLDASIARTCGAQTSGDVLLYDKAGRVIFEGGITGSRGHVGDNNALETLCKLILAPIPSSAPAVHEPVFGCAIYSSTDGQTCPLVTQEPK